MSASDSPVRSTVRLHVLLDPRAAL